MPVSKLKLVAGIVIPDSTIANQATELLIAHVPNLFIIIR